MVNGIGVLAWGVGGIEAEAAVLGQPLYFIMPEVIGLRLKGRLPLGSTATDLVLTVANLLRQEGVVGKFVEVFGPGLDHLSVPDRATIGNMSPEFGCTVTYFPIDDKTLEYMRASNRPEEQLALVESYCRTNMLWREHEDRIAYTKVLELDISTIEPTVAGPKRPQDKILLKNLKSTFIDFLSQSHHRDYISPDHRTMPTLGSLSHKQDHQSPPSGSEHLGTKERKALRTAWIDQGNDGFMLADGSVVIAAITSCTNTSNPYVMIGAGLVAKKARERGIDVRPWVKTSLAPGSKVVTDYLERADLMKDLEALQFHLVGYGCTSCIGNSGPLPPPIAQAIDQHQLVAASVLSGNRNFEARVHPQVKMNFLMSPMLVVAYALAGRVDIDLTQEPVSHDRNGQAVYLKDIWPTDSEINSILADVLSPKDFAKNYGEIFVGNKSWKTLEVPTGELYHWDGGSTYIKEAPFFNDLPTAVPETLDIKNARALLVLGDSITTDHISPAGSFDENSAAGRYLVSCGVSPRDFNSYGSRRGNDAVMVRGTFANVRIKNGLVDQEGGYTRYLPTGEVMTVFDAAMKYKQDQTPLVVLAGKEYGSGSSRDWAAKGTYLLGVQCVLAESFERIHRSNLIGMGVLPIQYQQGDTAKKLNLDGNEIFTITGVMEDLKPLKDLEVIAQKQNGTQVRFKATVRLDSDIEIAYYRNGGILQYVLRQYLNQ